MRKPTFWFTTRSDTNQAVQLQKMARGLKFQIKKVERLYYPCSENKGADQLRGYREADLHLCFRICKMLVFSWCGSYGKTVVYMGKLFFALKHRLCVPTTYVLSKNKKNITILTENCRSTAVKITIY